VKFWRAGCVSSRSRSCETPGARATRLDRDRDELKEIQWPDFGRATGGFHLGELRSMRNSFRFARLAATAFENVGYPSAISSMSFHCRRVSSTKAVSYFQIISCEYITLFGWHIHEIAKNYHSSHFNRRHRLRSVHLSCKMVSSKNGIAFGWKSKQYYHNNGQS